MNQQQRQQQQQQRPEQPLLQAMADGSFPQPFAPYTPEFFFDQRLTRVEQMLGHLIDMVTENRQEQRQEMDLLHSKIDLAISRGSLQREASFLTKDFEETRLESAAASTVMKKLPAIFINQPTKPDNPDTVDSNPSKAHVKEAVQALYKSPWAEDKTCSYDDAWISLEKHVEGAVDELAMRVPAQLHSKTWSFINKGTRDTVMKNFVGRVSKSEPYLPIDKFKGNWIARMLLVQKWNNYGRVDGKQPKPKKGKRGAASLSTSINDEER